MTNILAQVSGKVISSILIKMKTIFHIIPICEFWSSINEHNLVVSGTFGTKVTVKAISFLVKRDIRVIRLLTWNGCHSNLYIRGCVSDTG